MGVVVSLGSINVDRIRRVSGPDLAELADQYEWFPERGQTVEIRDVPADFVTTVDSIRHGGKGANQAVAAARAGAETEMLGKVGSDDEKLGVRERLGDGGVGVSHVETAAVPTGTAYVFVESDGESRVVVRPGANGTVDRDYVRRQYETILAADCLLLQNEIPTEPVTELLTDLATEAERPAVILDPGPTDGVEALLACEAVDYLVPNEAEYRALESRLDGFDGAVVRTRGGEDTVVDADEQFTVTPPTVQPVDTTGAGDVLSGVFAAQLAAGETLREAVEVAVVAGSLSTRTEGARDGIPTASEVRAYRQSRQPDA